MANLTPVDYDPFASVAPAGKKLTPVDYDPFAQQQAPGLFDRIRNDVINRATRTGEISASPQSNVSKILPIAGQVAQGLLGDPIAEGISSIGKTIPNPLQGPILDAISMPFSRAHEAIYDSNFGQGIRDTVGQGVSMYDNFARKNPVAAQQIEGGAQVLANVAPLVKFGPKAVANATETGADALINTGNKLVSSGEMQASSRQSKFVDDLIRPKQTAAVKIDQVGRTTEKGFLGSKKVALSPQEQVMADNVSQVPGISEKNTLQGNYNAIAKENIAEADRLQGLLKQNDTAISHDDLLDHFSGVTQSLSENPLLVGDAEKIGNKMVSKMIDIVDRHSKDGFINASDLLQARKDLDSWVKMQKGAGVFDPAKESALTISLRELRQATNNIIDEAVPDAAVRGSLSKQSTLYRAMENIAPKAAEEAPNKIARAVDKVKNAVPFKGDLAKAAALTGIGSVGALSSVPILAPVAGAGAAYGLYKGATSPSTKIALGKALRGFK